MIFASFSPQQLDCSFRAASSPALGCGKFRHLTLPHRKKTQQIGYCSQPGRVASSSGGSVSLRSHSGVAFYKSFLPLVASIAVLLSPNPAKAGFLSGFPGIESVPGPQLPSIEFLERFNEENQKKYAEADARFKESPILKKLLEKSKLNKEKNKQEILDKYCIRGAEWGVGECSTEGMSMEEREKFISMLKQKAGVK